MISSQLTKLGLVVVFIISSLSTMNAQKTIPEIEEGKGLVIFYRTKSFRGGGIKFTVKDNRGEYGQLTNGSFIAIPVEPGENTFWSQVISSDAITFTVEEGKTYYVKGTVKMGAVAGRPKFSLVNEKNAEKELKKIK